jgi:hypothetical protein
MSLKERAMIHSRPAMRRVAAMLAAALALGPVSSLPVAAQETLVAPEKNPPGDIPDNQVFVTYDAPSGFSLKVPEGWSRAAIAGGVKFFDKYDLIEATTGQADAAPTPASAQSREVADLVGSGHAVKVGTVEETKLKSGPALHIGYVANSEPNPVTSKQIRLEHERFVFFKDGKTVTLDLAAPAGADNVDQWQLISNSFRWK